MTTAALYRVVAIPDAVAAAVRSTGVSPRYGHPAHAEIAQGYGPCRQCLRDFAVGRERRILFTYDAFAGVEQLPLPGPIFIHEASCRRYPDDAGFPPDLRSHALTFEAYGRGRRLRAQEHVTGEVEPLLEQLLARPDVDYILVRDTGAGCYDCRIERLDAGLGHGSMYAENEAAGHRRRRHDPPKENSTP